MITVIIPTLNEASVIESAIESLLRCHGRFELIIADGYSSDGTLEIVRKFSRVKQVTSGRGRAKQMNKGAGLAKGNVLLFLHADTKLPITALQRIEEVMLDTSAVAGALCLTFDDSSLLLRLYSVFTRINHILFTYGDQGLFVRRHTFMSIGGFREIPIMEDVEIQKRLRRMGKSVKIRCPVVTSARRFLKCGIVRQQILNSVLLFLYRVGIPSEILKPFYSDSLETSR
jgi:rSAM/selenodomain-associated transferase 2